MRSNLAILQLSDSGLKVLIGEVANGRFHSWYHKNEEAYLFHNDEIDLIKLRILVKQAIERAQKSLQRHINSWFIIYDTEKISINKKLNIDMGTKRITKTTVNEIKSQIEYTCKEDDKNTIVYIAPLKFEWDSYHNKGKRIKSYGLPEEGSRVQNLHVDCIVYRVQKDKIVNLKRAFTSCEINIEALVPSPLCYSYLVKNQQKRSPLIIADIGNKTTKISLFHGKALIKYRVIDEGVIDLIKRINRKFKIGSLIKTSRIIKEELSLVKPENPNICLGHEIVTNNELITLTRDKLRRECARFAYNIHETIKNEALKIKENLLSFERVPIFVTGGLTDSEGYKEFLDKSSYDMYHLDVGTIEEIDNSFASTLGFAELVNEDILHSFEGVVCVSEKNYKLWNKISRKTRILNYKEDLNG